MLTQTTMGTALLRSLYSAIIAGLVAGLTVLQQSDNARDAVITGLLAALSILATRGLVEGGYDQKRQNNNAVASADVQVT